MVDTKVPLSSICHNYNLYITLRWETLSEQVRQRLPDAPTHNRLAPQGSRTFKKKRSRDCDRTSRTQHDLFYWENTAEGTRSDTAAICDIQSIRRIMSWHAIVFLNNVVKFGESKKKDLVKRLNFSNLQGLVVPRADIAVSVAIVYSWWLSNDLSIKWLLWLSGVSK